MPLAWFLVNDPIKLLAYRVLDATKKSAPKQLGEVKPKADAAKPDSAKPAEAKTTEPKPDAASEPQPDVKADSTKTDAAEPDATKTAAAKPAKSGPQSHLGSDNAKGDGANTRQLARWIASYNQTRPHSALGYLTPPAFAQPSLQRPICFATATIYADRPLLRRRSCANLSTKLWLQMDERQGSQQIGRRPTFLSGVTPPCLNRNPCKM